jgi:hypothetical protein
MMAAQKADMIMTTITTLAALQANLSSSKSSMSFLAILEDDLENDQM